MTGTNEAEGTRTGGCLCGAVRYSLSGALRPVVNCHCGQCQRFHGTYGAYTTVPMAQFALQEDVSLRWFDSSASARRGFCEKCGSSLFWQRTSGDEIAVAAGTMDQPTGLETKGDIFVADKGDYYTIPPGRPSLDQGGSSQLFAEN